MKPVMLHWLAPLSLTATVLVIGCDHASNVGERALGPLFSRVPGPRAPWVTKASMPTGRAELAAAAVSDSLVVVVGGFDQHNVLGAGQAAETYHPASNSWVIQAPMPTVRRSLAAATIRGQVYAVGGANGALNTTSALEALDPLTNVWSVKAPMPTARYGLTAGVIGDALLYAVGGVSSTAIVSTLEVYDPLSDAWSTKAPMPTARFFPAAGVISGKLYVVGGYVYGGVPLGTLEVYDPATDSWTTRAPMPTPRGPAVAVVNGVLYAIGGDASGTVEAYDPATDSWATMTPVPTARTFLAAGAVHRFVYALGGYGASPGDGLATNERSPRY